MLWTQMRLMQQWQTESELSNACSFSFTKHFHPHTPSYVLPCLLALSFRNCSYKIGDIVWPSSVAFAEFLGQTSFTADAELNELRFEGQRVLELVRMVQH